jgi:hypothetical protein
MWFWEFRRKPPLLEPYLWPKTACGKKQRSRQNQRRAMTFPWPYRCGYRVCPVLSQKAMASYSMVVPSSRPPMLNQGLTPRRSRGSTSDDAAPDAVAVGISGISARSSAYIAPHSHQQQSNDRDKSPVPRMNSDGILAGNVAIRRQIGRVRFF